MSTWTMSVHANPLRSLVHEFSCEMERHEPQVRFHREAEAKEEHVADPGPAALKRFRINRSDLIAHGYTEGCEQCKFVEENHKSKGGLQHTEACRKRILEAISQSEAGRARLAEYDERVNRNIAERIEAQVNKDQKHAEEAQPRREDGEALGRGRAAAEAAPAGEQHLRSKEWHDVPGGERAPMSPRLRPTQHDDVGVRGGMGLPADELPSETPGRDISDEPMDEGQHVHPDGGPAHGETYEDMHEDAGDGSGDGGDAVNGDIDMGFLGSLEPEVGDTVSELLLQQLGSTGRSYKREARRGFKHLVLEIYSPPRVTAEIRRQRHRYLLPGFAFDLTTVDHDDGEPWDFTRKDKREKARALLRRQRPLLLIGSPMCTAFSTWQYLNARKYKDPNAKLKAKIQAQLHMHFVVSLHCEQLEAGRYFLHEHPRWATSWNLPDVEGMLKIPNVQMVQGDQCQYGAQVRRGQHSGAPVMKPHVQLALSASGPVQAMFRVPGSLLQTQWRKARHVRGKITADMAKYPRELCRAVLKGTTNQLKKDRKFKPGCYGLQAVDDEEEIQDNLYGPARGYSGKSRDDLTGQVLRDDLVKAARMQELEYFCSKGVSLKVPQRRAREVNPSASDGFM